LVTSSVTYCNPPDTLLIQQFDVAYFSHNQSVLFNISAASVQPNVNVSANLFLNVYGLHPVNVTIDLCKILGGALCPLPMYNFTGSDSIPLPDSLGVPEKIPGIAFKIPDLEGFAQLTLTEIGTGNVKACVQATLSNGWSTHQPAVEWATGSVTLVALLVSLWHSLSPDAILPYRLIDLIYLYQTIASSAFLSLNYPSVYRAFTLNFAWAMGLFSTSPSSLLQRSINRMRHITGGTLADSTSGSAVGLVNRKLSPYNDLNDLARNLAPRSLQPRDAFIGVLDSFKPSRFPTLQSSSRFVSRGEVQTVTNETSNVLEAGVPIFVNSIHIASANAFMTIFISILILIAIALAVAGICWGFFHLAGRSHKWGQSRVLALQASLPLLARAWALRLGLITFTPLIIFIFYQWTLKDSWLSILLSVIMFIALTALLVYPAFLVIRFTIRSSASTLYSDPTHIATTGPIFAQYRAPRFYFFLPLLIAVFLKAIIIAFVEGHGRAQIILVLLVEIAVLALHLVLKPYKTRGGDILSSYLAITRVVGTGLLIAFVENLAVAAIPRVVIGIVIAVIFSVAILVLVANLVLHSGIQHLLPIRRSKHELSSPTSELSILEQGDHKSNNSSEHTGRPRNPTPEHNVPLDPHVNQPYPSMTATPTSVQHSLGTQDSESITVGSLLPNRWSFSPPQSPPASASHHEHNLLDSSHQQA
ncbi:hypothetical protein BD779DRAFT_1437472, partial [Infundibulicybe gibba]